MIWFTRSIKTQCSFQTPLNQCSHEPTFTFCLAKKCRCGNWIRSWWRQISFDWKSRCSVARWKQRLANEAKYNYRKRCVPHCGGIFNPKRQNSSTRKNNKHSSDDCQTSNSGRLCVGSLCRSLPFTALKFFVSLRWTLSCACFSINWIWPNNREFATQKYLSCVPDKNVSC